jgi:hypothetical protein
VGGAFRKLMFWDDHPSLSQACACDSSNYTNFPVSINFTPQPNQFYAFRHPIRLQRHHNATPFFCSVAFNCIFSQRTRVGPLRTQPRQWGTACLHAVKVSRLYHLAVSVLTASLGRSRDGIYEPVLADSEREAVADLLQYLENVRSSEQTYCPF